MEASAQPVFTCLAKRRSDQISTAAEAMAVEAEKKRRAGNARGCTTLAIEALRLGPSPLAHRLVGRYLIANGRTSESSRHFDLACDLDPADWETRLEMVDNIVATDKFSGAGLDLDIARRAECRAREACEIAAAERGANEREGLLDARRLARFVPVEIHALNLLVRLRRVFDDREGQDCAMSQAAELARRFLDLPTSLLPQLGSGSLGGEPIPSTKVLTVRGRAVMVERLATYPALFRIQGLLSAEDCDNVITRATPELEDAGVAMRGGGQIQGFRTSSMAWLSTAEDDILRELTERVAELVGLPASCLLTGAAPDSGHVQVVSYGPSQQYGVHHDCNGLIRRFATCLYYLNNVEEGGQTVFPAASQKSDDWSFLHDVDSAISYFLAPEHTLLGSSIVGDETKLHALKHNNDRKLRVTGQPFSQGVSVTPIRGDAILWYNYDKFGRVDPRAVHCSKPVARGHKWAANHWISLTPGELLMDVLDSSSTRATVPSPDSP